MFASDEPRSTRRRIRSATLDYAAQWYADSLEDAVVRKSPVRIISDIMPLIDRVTKDMVAAMKNREEARLSAIRMVKAALMKAKVDSPKPLDEAAEMALLKQLIKQRIDAAEMYRKAGRTEQAEKEEAERALIEAYLPAGASEAEIDAAIESAMGETGATTIKQMGLVMKAAQSKLAGKSVDGKMMSDKVKAKLQ